MTVAFATTDLARVDAQFGQAAHLAVYDVTARGAVLEHVVVFGAAGEGGARYRFADRAASIAGCSILYVSAIGPSVVARLARLGIRPATASAEERIEALLASASALLSGRSDLSFPREVNA